ncbi:hypothetical protein PFISCL1PPCAC_8775, partial [Pristionchus fissidentatus]
SDQPIGRTCCMSAVSLLRAGYEKKLRDEFERRRIVEEDWKKADEERLSLLQERDALRSILGVTVGRREGREKSKRRGECERHKKASNHIRSVSADGGSYARNLEGRVKQMREEISSLRRFLAEMEGELRRRDGRIVTMQSEEMASRDRERVLVERLEEAIEVANGGMETERILREELDYAHFRLSSAAAAAAGVGRMQHDPAADAADYQLDASNSSVHRRLEEVTEMLGENEERAEEQDKILEEMREQISIVINERDELASRLHRMENKYQKAKADVTALRDTVERLTDSADASGRLVDGKSNLQRARELHAATEAAAAAAERNRREGDLQQLQHDAADHALLVALVEDERAMARSLHEDLDVTRKMLLDRDSEVHQLTAELSEARVWMSAASTEIEMERGRTEAASAAGEADTTAYATALDESLRESEGLRQRLSDSLKQCASYAAKLEAQGRDLVAVKKELQRLQLTR